MVATSTPTATANSTPIPSSPTLISLPAGLAVHLDVGRPQPQSAGHASGSVVIGMHVGSHHCYTLVPQPGQDNQATFTRIALALERDCHHPRHLGNHTGWLTGKSGLHCPDGPRVGTTTHHPIEPALRSVR